MCVSKYKENKPIIQFYNVVAPTDYIMALSKQPNQIVSEKERPKERLYAWYIIECPFYTENGLKKLIWCCSGAMGMEKGKRSIAGTLNTIPKIKHLKNPKK